MKLGSTLAAILWSSVFLLLAACGGDPPFSSGVDGNKTVSSYTQGDAEKFCNSEANFVNGRYSHERRCMMNSAGEIAMTAKCSASDADLQAQCKSLYDTCVADPTVFKDLDPSNCIATLPGTTCPAKTADLNACVSEMASSLDTVLASIPSCSAFAIAACLNLQSMLQATKSTCPTLRAECPEVVSAID